MRGSDFVDFLFDLLPKRWVQVGLLLLLVGMSLTHWYEPVTWYVLDKAQGFADQWATVLHDAISTSAAVTPLTVP